MTDPSRERGRWEAVEPYVRTLLDALPDQIWFMTPDLSQVLYSTESFESIYGMSLDELYADPSSPLRLGHPDDTGEIERVLHSRLPDNRPHEFVIRIRARDGADRVVRFRSVPIVDDDGRIELVGGITEDITEQEADRERVEELNELLRTILDSTTDAVGLIDGNDRIRYVNRRVRELAGIDPDADYSGRPVAEVIPGRTDLMRDLTHAVMNDGQTRRVAWHDPTADRWLESTIAPASDGVLVVTDDRTEQRLAEARERQWAEANNRADRLDALGRMAGGIAHDVGNLMRLALSGLADAAAAANELDDDVRAGIDDAARAVERALATTHQLLVFSRGTEQPPRPTSLDTVVAEMSTLVERTLGNHIEVSVHLHAGGVNVMSDPSRLEQLVLNLATNAGTAMPDGGRFEITTTQIDADSTDLGLPPGSYVQLVAADTGRGMHPDVAEHAFEPFFTTDEVHGTGLGLSTVYGTAVAAGGTALIESRIGDGTRVVIYLPVVASGDQRATKILLVDSFGPESDDALEALTAAGFDVNRLTPARFISELDRNGDYDVVALDPMADGGAGRLLVERIRAAHPRLPIVLLAGATSLPDLADHAQVSFVKSPFGHPELARAVESAIAER